jgi:hypothetical protein
MLAKDMWRIKYFFQVRILHVFRLYAFVIYLLTPPRIYNYALVPRKTVNSICPQGTRSLTTVYVQCQHVQL